MSDNIDNINNTKIFSSGNVFVSNNNINDNVIVSNDYVIVSNKSRTKDTKKVTAGKR